jgi:hypothetical protein
MLMPMWRRLVEIGLQEICEPRHAAVKVLVARRVFVGRTRDLVAVVAHVVAIRGKCNRANPVRRQLKLKPEVFANLRLQLV